jgi:4-hydroxy-3-methylbut-2-enyl diphosphate reductase IspH
MKGMTGGGSLSQSGNVNLNDRSRTTGSVSPSATICTATHHQRYTVQFLRPKIKYVVVGGRKCSDSRLRWCESGA